MTDSDVPSISSAWLKWLQDCQETASEVIREVTAEPAETRDAESQSLRFALYARLVTLLGTACLLADHDKQLDLRICCRSLIECAVHMAGGDRDSGYAQKLKDDDLASRLSRGKAFKRGQASADSESVKLLDEFLSRDFGTIKRLKINLLADDSQFPRLIHAFRETSADAVHVTWTSLLRHCVDDGEGTIRCIVNPSLNAEELHDTLSLIALSVLIGTLILARNLPNGDEIVTKFADLQARFHNLRRANEAEERT